VSEQFYIIVKLITVIYLEWTYKSWLPV